MSLFNIVLFCVLCGPAFASVAFRRCVGHSRNICKVKSLHIAPCAGVKKCFLQKGQDISIAIEIVPNFDARSLKTGIYWNSGTKFWPLPILESDDACSHTRCPIKTGKTHTLTYKSSANFIELLPRSAFTIRWKAWSEKNENQACCFETTVSKNTRGVTLHMEEEKALLKYGRLIKL